MKPRKTYLSFIFCLCSLFSFSQTNLVPNPSFETFSNCPTLLGQLVLAQSWYSAYGSGDYYNACGNANAGVPQNLIGYSLANTDSAYAGLALFSKPLSNAREYIEVQLINTLQAGKKYCVIFYVSLADSAQYSTSSISAYLSFNGVAGNNVSQILTYSPQINNPNGNYLSDKNSWTLVVDSFTSVGTERFITIGNFKDDTNTDTLYVGGSSTTINPYDWRFAYYYIDDVWIGLCDSLLGISEQTSPSFTVSPNPSNGIFTISHAELVSASQIEVYNTLGELIFSQELQTTNSELDLRGKSPGIYFITLRTANGISTQKLVIQ